VTVVIDGTVALAWCLGDETSGQADLVLSLLATTRAAVPSHWELEVVQGLMAAERRGHIDSGDLDRLIGLMAALPVDIEPPGRSEALRVTQRLAKRHTLTPFEASYIELALRRAFQLVTMDPAVAQAARLEGVGG
jgi:predicted nucleic acid-binding protein